MAVDKHVVRVLVGSTWFDVTDYKKTSSGFTFTDRHSGRVVSGPASSVVATESEPKGKK